MSIRIASYNIRKTVGIDWVRDADRISRVLEEINADIVVLQEVDRRFGSRKGTLSTEKLKQSGYDLINLSLREQGQGWHGNALLYRHHIRAVESGRLPLPYFSPRGAVATTFEFEANKRLRLIGTHLALLGNMRKKQIHALVKDVEQQSENLPTLIAGDFNEWRKRGVAYRAFGAHLNIVTPGASFHSTNPLLPLDRFVLTKNIGVKNQGVHHSKLASRASDHLPIYIDIEFKEIDCQNQS